MYCTFITITLPEHFTADTDIMYASRRVDVINIAFHISR